jgi:type IV pilus biogenesis protein PilP
MRNNILITILALLLSSPVIKAAEDPAVDSSSLFQRRAQAIAEIHVKELEKQAHAGPGDKDTAGKSLAPATTNRSWPVRLIGIYGSGDRLFATFRLADGESRDFVPGEAVPGFGVIRAVLPAAVLDQSRRFHKIDTQGGDAP